MAVISIDRGSLHAELCNSSARCTLLSAPVRYGRGPFKPTRQAKPVAGQPLDSNSVKTDDAVPRGAKVLTYATVKSVSITRRCPLVRVLLASSNIPKYNDKRKKAQHVEEGHDPLYERQFSIQNGIGEDSNEQNGPRKTCDLPLMRLVT